MNDKKFTPTEIESVLVEKKSGRFTITGPNGSGKSSLLLNLKNQFNSSAIYLPTHHQLVLAKNQISLSSGEIALTALKDLQSEPCDFLLLDEWDANLSVENCSILDKVIDQLSLDKIVVEVRHSNNLVTTSGK